MSGFKLESCPLCKGTARLISAADPSGLEGDVMYFAECEQCKAKGGYHDCERDAAEAWNAREAERCMGIKGCPMCGSSGQLYRTAAPGGKYVWSVGCGMFGCLSTGFFDTKEEAINSWNGDTSEKECKMKSECNRSDWVSFMLRTSYEQTHKMLLLFEKWQQSGDREELEELQDELAAWKTFPEERESALECYCNQAGLFDREVGRLAGYIVAGEFEFAAYVAQKLLERTKTESEEVAE